MLKQARTSNFFVLSKNPLLGTCDLSGALLRPDPQPLQRGLAASSAPAVKVRVEERTSHPILPLPLQGHLGPWTPSRQPGGA